VVRELDGLVRRRLPDERVDELKDGLRELLQLA
jgi:hypothetical protein